jgi:dihydroneopterin aldolase
VKSIEIRNIKVFAHHGVTEEEKEKGQEFLLNVELALDEDTALTDDISATVDYAEVAGTVARMATSGRYDLIETLACKIVDHLLTFDGVKEAAVTVKKPQAPLPVEADWVGVTVRRGRGGTGSSSKEGAPH